MIRPHDVLRSIPYSWYNVNNRRFDYDAPQSEVQEDDDALEVELLAKLSTRHVSVRDHL